MAKCIVTKAAFTEALVTQLLERLRKDAVHAGIEVEFRVNVYQAECGPRAIVTMTAGPTLPVCKECRKPSLKPLAKWRNKPGIPGVHYVCPECHERLSASEGACT